MADVYDRVWAYDQEAEQARWDEAQDEAREASADRFVLAIIQAFRR